MIPLWRKIPESVRIAIFVLILFALLWGILAWKTYKRIEGFGGGLLIEAFGMLLDILVIGIIILALNEIRDRRKRIFGWQEEIDSLSRWAGREAMHRIEGLLKRMRSDGAKKVDLKFCYLFNANFREMDLRGVYFGFSNLSRAVFVNSDLREVSFWGANLSNAFLTQAKLQGAFLAEANLTGATLVSTDFEDAKIKNFAVVTKANFEGANLRNVDFRRCDLRRAVNLTLDQISQTKTLYEAQLDPDLLEQVNRQYPHLRERPEDEEV
jgi:BTB/POZ domain-containing protein KCTD9